MAPSSARLLAAIAAEGTRLAATRPPEEALAEAATVVYRSLAGRLDGCSVAELAELGATHERLLESTPFWDGTALQLRDGSAGRRKAGAWFTPPALAEHLLDLALEPTLDELDDPLGVRVLDPACGAGLFLLLAARRIARRCSLSPRDPSVLRCLYGVDRDPAVVELARSCLGGGQLQVGDAMLDELPEVDVVVGNPPFLNRLERRSALAAETVTRLNDRMPGVLGPYTDVSAVFLARAVDWVRPGGRIGLVQPQSVLAARDAAGVRRHVSRTCALEALWASDEPVFTANVLTCAPVLRRGGVQGPVRRTHGPAFTGLLPASSSLSAEWGPLLAAGLGVPEVRLGGSGVIGDEAECAADFRDEYYGLEPYVHEAASGPGVPLVTTGLVDPAVCLWGERPTRFCKRSWQAPVVDVGSILEPRLAAWAARRLVPKVLVGTQGRVVEAVVDEHGTWLPSVPTISVVAPGEMLWHLLAVLLAPPVAAYAAATFAGTALTMHRIKLSARQVAALPLPPAGPLWDEAAASAEAAQRDPADRRRHLERVGALMSEAYGADEAVLSWWLQRL